MDLPPQSNLVQDALSALLRAIEHTYSVPFDVTCGTKGFGVGGHAEIGLGGQTHRFKTLGHDPLYGWVFGTGNIMTNALTNYRMSTYVSPLDLLFESIERRKPDSVAVRQYKVFKLAAGDVCSK